MEFTTSYCPNLQCTHYGKRGFGTHLVQRGADRGIPRLLWGSGSVRTKNGAQAVGHLQPEGPTYSSTGLRPSFCPKMWGLAGTQLFPGEPKVAPW